ncbi:hypothetical protein D0T84_12360 [Dysgonomonas sp. 521]|uniref:bacteriocin immunity protein n=1 Tax=Dysgonomonas sp. 521 TaxID=2302932 RepID=UPI0013D175BD|nr:bacteriocin immunity protein [Dysgonomonas sp. 521]NDV95701.1 hypothetical protein [Dysgonomonas sp. 521]
MTRKELIQLVEQILDVEKYSEKQLDDMLELLHRNVPHPAVANLIYYDNLSPEEIVDKALDYKPIQL